MFKMTYNINMGAFKKISLFLALKDHTLHHRARMGFYLG